MSKTVRSIVKNNFLQFEELSDNGQNRQKWTANVSREDLEKLYKVFVENKFDTIKNDEREGIVYDAGSESIGITVSGTKYFSVTYGKNSPLSGKNLERYQAVGKAINDLVGKYQSRKSGIS